MEKDLFSKKAREVFTKATLLEIKMDQATDPNEFTRLHERYCRLLSRYNLWSDEFIGRPVEDLPFWALLIYEDNGKWGVHDTYWNCELPAVYDSIKPISESGMFIVERDGKFGVLFVDMVIKTLIGIEYDAIEIAKEFQLILRKENKYYYFNCNELSQIGFDEIRVPLCAGWFRVRIGNEWGYMDGDLNFTSDKSKAHEFMFPQQPHYYDEQAELSREIIDNCDRLGTAYKEGPQGWDEWMSMTNAGFTLSVTPHSSIVHEDGRYGIDDFLGYRIVKAEYDEIIMEPGSVGTRTAYGRKAGQWSLLLDGGKRVKCPVTSEEKPKKALYGNWLVIKKNGKYGLYDTLEERWLLEPAYDKIQEQHEKDCIITRQGEKYGFYSLEYHLPPQFDSILLGRCLSFVRVVIHGDTCFLDKDGQTTTDIAKARIRTTCPSYLQD